MHLTVVCSQVPDNYTPPTPITTPVMGFPVEAPQPLNHAQVPPGAPQEPSVQVGVWHGCSLISHAANTVFTPCVHILVFPQLLQQLPAERVEQKEIPADHMVLKSTFDSLVQRCQLAAGDPVSFTVGGCDCIHIYSLRKFGFYWLCNDYKYFLFQQTKRKLDDAGKRLGYLYDKLREQSVRNDYMYTKVNEPCAKVRSEVKVLIDTHQRIC